MNFTQRYQKLNQKQKQAVDTIDGPVMVVAGPGTGKTELLSMRAANILRQTDMLPENILCLTFTDSGSIAMQKRLVDIIGREAYGISVFTFHAFGSEVMSHYREYFYNGADFRPADELTRHTIITDILHTLEPSNPLKSIMNGEFTSVGMIISAISDIKRAGLTPDELTAILDANDQVIAAAEPILADIFSARVSKTTFEKLSQAAEQLSDINEPQPVPTMPRLSDILRTSLQRTLNEAINHPKITPPITEWKNTWLTKDESKNIIMMAKKRQYKLRAVVDVYQKYLQAMQAAELYDFDDMITQVVHAIETKAELQAELQEKYQYIMVDEFQDTNHAQMRILRALTNSPTDHQPNLLVVGDDDQAIYGFQGADIGNILDFTNHYPQAKLITLVDNYRSAECILNSARSVISQGNERLEGRIANLDKTLNAHAKLTKPNSSLVTNATTASEREWVANDIAASIKAGQNPGEITVLARRHADLIALLPYLTQYNIPVSYDQNDNVLDNDLVAQLMDLARVITNLADGELGNVNALLPRLMAHPAWGFKAEVLWDISLRAYKKKLEWLEVISANPATKPFADWLIACAQASHHTPIERMLDLMVGEGSEAKAFNENFTSPLKDYFLGDETRFVHHLQNFTALRTKLREYKPNQYQARLSDLLNFVDLCNQTKTTITSQHHIGKDNESVKLMSAHASKGLEFDTVYILDATDTSWGLKASQGGNSIAYPDNLRLRRNTNSPEERLRLFFVGMTRAKRRLVISRALQTETGKELMLANFLAGDVNLNEQIIDAEENSEQVQATTVTTEWYAPIIDLPSATMQNYLASSLEQYKLSPTHINNFIDIPNGGPKAFLINNLLHFPSASSPNASYGTAVHNALQFAHDAVRANGEVPPIKAIIDRFKLEINRSPMTPEELNHFTQKGIDSITTFLQSKSNTFNANQHAELNFFNQQVIINGTHLTGKLDLADIDKQAKTITVTDYKTGAPLYAWNKGAEHIKIKAHKYRQQLLHYKLLVENSRDWHNYTFVDGILQFVEPDKAGEIVDIRLGDVSSEEMQDFIKLTEAVWRHIKNLYFPDTDSYEPNYRGILAFEQDLRDGII